MIEADPATTPPCIYGPSGCSGGSIGDWTAGVNYPILNPGAAEAAEVNSDFAIAYFPTLYGVAPNGEIYEIGQEDFETWEMWVAESFQMHNTSWTQKDDGECPPFFIDLHPVGGHGEISYEWSNGATSEDLYDLEAGEYYVTLTDENDYEAVLGPFEIDYNLDIELVDIGHNLCEGNMEGFIEVEMVEGSGDYEYEWSNGETTPYIDNLDGGNYTVLAIDTDTGCEIEMEFEVEEPDELEYELEVTQPDCSGNQIGTVEFLVDGGTWPILFYFEDFETEDEYLELEPGVYEVTIVDNNNCSVRVEAFEIEETELPEAYSSATGLLSCINASVGIAVDSSSMGNDISYAWFDPSMTYIGGDSLTSVDSAGLYTLQVINEMTGCIASSTVMVHEDYTEPIASGEALNNIDCNNNTASLVAQGIVPGDTTVSVLWSTSNGSILSDPTALEIQVSAAGTYQLMVTNDLSGCYSTAIVDVESVDIPEIMVDGNPDFCEGSSTTLCIQQGLEETVAWYKDGEYVTEASCIIIEETALLEVVLANSVTGCEAIQSIAAVSNELPSTSYIGNTDFCEGDIAQICVDALPQDHSVEWRTGSLLIGEQNCINVDVEGDITLTVINELTSCESSELITLNQVLPPEIIVSGYPEFCESTGGTQICIDNMNGDAVWRSNGEEIGSGICITVVEAGDYEVEFTDDLTGCSSVELITAVELPLPVVMLESSGLLDCTNGEVTLTAETDHENYNITWVNEASETIATTDDVIVTEPGLYYAYVESEEGCVGASSVIVEQDPEDLPSVDFDFEKDDFDFSFTNLIEGSYNNLEWDFGDGTVSNELNPSHSYVTPGFYTVVLTVTNDCGTVTHEIQLAAYAPLNLTLFSTDVSCYDLSDGQVSVNADGGIPPYSYEWTDPVSGADTGNLSGLEPGEYTVIVRDESGQEVSQTVYISSPDELVVQGGVEYVTGNGLGSIILEVTGGNGGYTYLWSNGSTDRDQSDLEPGIYTVVVTDQQGCEATLSFTVEESTSTNDIETLKSFDVFPNPVADICRVRLELESTVNGQLNIYSLLGERIFQQKIQASRVSIDLDVSAWDSGLYLIELSTAEGVAVKRLLVNGSR